MQFILLEQLFLPETAVGRLLLPFFQANSLLKQTLLDDLTLIDMDFTQILFLLANAAVYLLIGCAIFSLCIQVAKKKGLLDFY